MNAFFSDLDHTLIYSHRIRIPGPKVPVERLDGKEQSYMTQEAWSFFRTAGWLSLIPVTTRSEAQYRRLQFPEDFHIRYALVCNGGKLLADGAEDREWSERTMELVREDLPELEELGKRLGELCGQEVHAPERYYYYVKTTEPERICGALERGNRKGRIRISHDHGKVYLFPQNVCKGTAVRRFAEKYEINVSAGAGDSIMDIPMLEAVDFPLAPASVCGKLRHPNAGKLAGEILSDQICRALEALHRTGKF